MTDRRSERARARPGGGFARTDCGLRDPFGNHLRIGQPKEGPIEFPDPAQFAAGNA